MRLRFSHLLLLTLVFLASACTKYKDVPYFQNLKRDEQLTEKITNYEPMTIQSGDLLGVQVTSLNHEADALINYNMERPNASAVSVGRPEENSVYGFLVNQEGNINVAYIGTTKAAGYTLEQFRIILQEKLSTYLKNPVVNVRLQNFRISILGDVKSPGVYYSQNERLSIPEALGMAGDLNVTGLRKNILLVREVDGERKYINIDLTSKALLSSPNYYLRNHDVLYIQPSKERVQASDSAFQKASILISALSLLAIFITRYK